MSKIYYASQREVMKYFTQDNQDDIILLKYMVNSLYHLILETEKGSKISSLKLIEMLNFKKVKI